MSDRLCISKHEFELRLLVTGTHHYSCELHGSERYALRRRCQRDEYRTPLANSLVARCRACRAPTTGGLTRTSEERKASRAPSNSEDILVAGLSERTVKPLPHPYPEACDVDIGRNFSAASTSLSRTTERRGQRNHGSRPPSTPTSNPSMVGI